MIVCHALIVDCNWLIFFLYNGRQPLETQLGAASWQVALLSVTIILLSVNACYKYRKEVEVYDAIYCQFSSIL